MKLALLAVGAALTLAAANVPTLLIGVALFAAGAYMEWRSQS